MTHVKWLEQGLACGECPAGGSPRHYAGSDPRPPSSWSVVFCFPPPHPGSLRKSLRGYCPEGCAVHIWGSHSLDCRANSDVTGTAPAQPPWCAQWCRIAHPHRGREVTPGVLGSHSTRACLRLVWGRPRAAGPGVGLGGSDRRCSALSEAGGWWADSGLVPRLPRWPSCSTRRA